MFELRPAVLHEQGLVPAVTILVEHVGREVGARTSVRGTLGRYEPTTEQLVYRSLQEALSNVRKHAHPSSIVVTLAERGGVLTSEVHDDGRGFELERVRTRPRASLHLGISTMVERIRAVDGDVRISSAPGEGTTVRIAVPAR
jgi:signal transduction histidine kinase